MSFKDDVLDAVANSPDTVRNALRDPEVLAALGDIGIGGAGGIQVLELHAPSATAKRHTGLGRTLCGRNGIRHPIVTCKNCLKTLASTSSP